MCILCFVNIRLELVVVLGCYNFGEMMAKISNAMWHEYNTMNSYVLFALIITSD